MVSIRTCQFLFAIPIVWSLPYCTDRVQSDDRVWLKQSAIVSNRTLYVGTIIEYDSKRLKIRSSGDRLLEVESSRISRISTTYSDAQNAALQAFRKHQFPTALDLLDQALKAEKREWVQREIIAQKIFCHKATGNWPDACRLYLELSRIHRSHRFHHSIPLSWQHTSIDKEQELFFLSLMKKSPVERLIASSWLLEGQHRAAAERALREIAEEFGPSTKDKPADHWVGQLAEFQRLRNAENGDIAETQKQLDELLPKFRAGPLVVFGQILSQHDRHLDAALVWMRIPILHNEFFRESALALSLTGDALIKDGKTREARLVLKEITTRFAGSEQNAFAQKRLIQLGVKTPNKSQR